MIHDYGIEEVMEDLIENGLPENLVPEVEQLLINSHAEAEKWEKKYKELSVKHSWCSSPESMGR
ncbi:hypothetical protein [Listeria booriae]|uniref:Uncharacterized protein n=1 Tax=Listeria booriae TaxID=1552123 RepID=A0A841XN92_9LIST|nr:hypothetical protein [Listeria booriae]MBC1316624.1 hypothetical protein [Listeria booriae]MBC1801022.1 hypothetical protein [Listeria booriae]